jgi:hypothetical protein
MMGGSCSGVKWGKRKQRLSARGRSDQVEAVAKVKSNNRKEKADRRS